MKVNFAHLKEISTSGGWINFAVFDARSISGSKADNTALLAQLTAKARAVGLKVDQSALAFEQNGLIQFHGDKNLVEYLSRHGIPQWTHKIDT